MLNTVSINNLILTTISQVGGSVIPTYRGGK